MLCPICQRPSTDVVNSRPHKKRSSVWRRRNCSSCDTTFTTTESPRIEWRVRYDTGSVAPLNKGILIVSIARSFQHDPHAGAEAASDLADTIIDTCTEHVDDTQLLPASKLAALTHRALEHFDYNAGLAYAIQHNLSIARKKRR